MDSTINYTMTEHKVKVGKTDFIVRNFLPIFANEDESQNAKRDVEGKLFRIFSKYTPCTA